MLRVVLPFDNWVMVPWELPSYYDTTIAGKTNQKEKEREREKKNNGGGFGGGRLGQLAMVHDGSGCSSKLPMAVDDGGG